ncbi:MAG: DUF389 domain-containing protein [Myxococcales bacterium]|nr:DUF389 domain-containing protein [Myxococcales bacterium]USN51553.1 MAG: DUF389 domain-containing protein [Myxococcales bacterium]
MRIQTTAIEDKELSLSDLFMGIFDWTRRRLRSQFDLSKDDADETELIETFRQHIGLRGSNLWVLFFAILIASVGLNINSTPVVIGAMLISPLLGPIMGIGFGAAILDLDMVRESFRNLSIAVLTSVISSALYFYLSPLHQSNSELLARTSPTAYDILIAFFGGLAVSIAFTRKNKTTSVIMGAAIATALMPPLCTAGYGVAHWNLRFFIGALYLFFINSTYICLATYLVTRMIGVRQRRRQSDAIWNKYLPKIIAGLAILALLPSIYLAYKLIQHQIFQDKIDQFIKHEIIENNFDLLQKSLTEEKSGDYKLRLVVFGDGKVALLKDTLASKLGRYGLENVHLQIENTLSEIPALDMSQLKTGVIEELFAKNENKLKERENQINILETKIKSLEDAIVNSPELLKELAVEHPELKELVLVKTMQKNGQVELVGYIESNRDMSKIEINKVKEWLKIRTKSSVINVLFKVVE